MAMEASCAKVEAESLRCALVRAAGELCCRAGNEQTPVGELRALYAGLKQLLDAQNGQAFTAHTEQVEEQQEQATQSNFHSNPAAEEAFPAAVGSTLAQHSSASTRVGRVKAKGKGKGKAKVAAVISNFNTPDPVAVHVPLAVASTVDDASPAASGVVRLQLLPTETLGEVTSFVSTRDILLSMTSVCKQWYERMSGPLGWMGVTISNDGLPGLDDVRLAFHSQLWRDAWALSLKPVPVNAGRRGATQAPVCPGDSALSLFLHVCTNLNSVSLHSCPDVTDATLWALANSSCQTSLQSLSLESAHVSDVGVRELQRCTALRRLCIAGCEDVGDTALESISRSCSSLHTVLAASSGVADRGIRTLTEQCLGLQELDLGGTDITDKSLRSIALGCPDLRRLNVSETDISDEGAALLAACVHLESLNLRATRLLTDPAMTAIARRCTSLVHLWLDWCDALTDSAMQAVAACRHIRTLSLSHCPRITDTGVKALAQGCRLMHYLDLSHCFNVTDDAIAAVARSCPSLHSLALFGCYKVTPWGVKQVPSGCNLMMNH